MKLTDFAGLDAKMEQLMRSAQAGRIVHALLFVGPGGTGKKSLAELMARTVLCAAHVPDRPCDACPACKKCLNGMHPDVHFVTPEKNTIKVDQIRDLTEKLALASYEGGKKIAVIEHAEAMNESAQNALLKTLENPTGDTLFFLLTDAPGALLPTVVSRCLQVRFRCLENDSCTQVLEKRGIESGRAQLLSALSQGSVGRALEIDADEGYIELRGRVIDALEGLKKPVDVLGAMARIGDDKGRERDVLEILELWARDLMRVQNGAQPMQIQDADRLRKSAFCGSRLLQSVILARRQLSDNVSWGGILENMFFRLAGERG